MPPSETLDGNAPDNCSAVLVLIDVISDFEFEDGEKLFENALPMARNIAALKKRAAQAGIPAVYVNDNFGKWQSDFKNLLEHACGEAVRGAEIAEMLKPGEDDYFVLKPKHSGFYSTTLELLLNHLKSKTLILTGIATDVCILFTAGDAYMRDYKLVVPADCVAAIGTDESERALKYMERKLKADIRPSAQIDLSELLKKD